MGVIVVAGPNGDAEFEVDGEKPTQAELAEIDRILYPQEYAARDVVRKSPVSGASMEQIREYARMREQAGITPDGKQMSPEEYANVYREEGVDYTTGLQDVGNFSRFGFGRMETDEGRANYLRRSVGEGGFRQDALGRFVLTKQGRETLGMGEGAELAIDEEGLSFGDLKEFLGQSGMPLAAGIGAGLMASGVGFVPGVLISAGAAGVAKVLDEGIEYAQGLQDQTFQDVMRDAAVEAAFSGAGEVFGRGVSKVLGRFFKGPDTKFSEEQRAALRAALAEKAVPSIAGVTPAEFRPGLRLLDAFSQAVFPNEAAARSNLDVLLRQLEEIGINPTAVDDLGDALGRDIKNKYATMSEQLADNERYLTTVIDKDLNKAAAALRKDGVIPKNLADILRIRKTVFDQNYDSLVASPLNVLKGQKFIPMGGVKAELDRIVQEAPEANLKNSEFVKAVYKLAGRDGNAQVTYEDIARLRTSIGQAMKNTELVGGAPIQSLSSLRAALTNALEDAELKLAGAAGAPLPDGSTVVNMGGMSVTFKNASEALGFMRRANSLYRNAMRRFDNVETINVIKQAQKGQLNEGYVLNTLLKKDNPEALDQLLRAIRGAKFVEGLPPGPRTTRRQLINGMTVQQARAEAARLPEGSQARRLLDQQIREVEEQVSLVSGTARVGAEEAERVRKSFATMYLDKAIKDSTRVSSTGVDYIDGKAFDANFGELGSTLNVLFRGEIDALNDLRYVMKRGEVDVAPTIFSQMMRRSPDLTEAFQGVKEAAQEMSKVKGARLTRILEDGDPEAVAREVLRSPRNFREAEKILSPDTMEQVRDAAMMNILRQVDIFPNRAGQIAPTDDLFNGFESGRLGARFKNILNSYDKETLNAVFGEEAAKNLRKVAENMTKYSNEAIKGKGSIVAAGVAGTMASVSVLFSPLAALAPLAKFFVLSKALRNPTILGLLSRTRDKNSVRQLMSGKLKSGDPLGQGLQIVQQLVAQALLQGGRSIAEQGEQETQAAQALAQRQSQEARQNEGVNQMLTGLNQLGQTATQAVTSPIQTLAQTLQPPSPVASARANPILVPNPTTRATFGQ